MIKSFVRFGVGYIAACLVVGLLFACSLVIPALLKDAGKAGWQTLMTFTLLNGLFIGVIALVPTLISIAIARWVDRRSALFYIGAGACVGLVSYLVWFWLIALWTMEPLSALPPPSDYALAFAVALLFFGGGGAVAGLVYWLVGVRQAKR